jgi:hypothetical protein
MQFPSVSPAIVELSAIAPDGLNFWYAPVSVTVTDAVAACPITIVDGVTAKVIVVGRGFTVSPPDPELALCTVFAANDADSVRDPANCGVKTAAHVAVPGVAPAARVHPAIVSPATEEPIDTVPAGVTAVPSACVSATVTVSVAGWPTITTAGLIVSVVDVLRVFTCSVALP